MENKSVGSGDKLRRTLAEMKRKLESQGIKVRDMSSEIKSIGIVGGIGPRQRQNQPKKQEPKERCE